MRRATLAAFAVLCAQGCAWRMGGASLQASATPASFSLLSTSADDDRWYILGDEGWIWFVDTGYTVTTCDDDYVYDNTLPTGGRYRTAGLAGPVRGELANVGTITLGAHRLDNVICATRDLDLTSSIEDIPEARIAGVIGMDLLGLFVLDFDATAGTLHVHAPGTERPPPQTATVVPLRRLAGPGPGRRFKVPIHYGQQTLWPLFDTGANRSLLDTAQLGLAPVHTQDVEVGGTGGSGSIRHQLGYVDVADAHLGPLPLEPLLVAEAMAHLQDGLLGLDVLGTHHWVLDAPGRTLWLMPVDEPFALVPYDRHDNVSGSRVRRRSVLVD